MYILYYTCGNFFLTCTFLLQEHVIINTLFDVLDSNIISMVLFLNVNSKVKYNIFFIYY